MHNSKPVLLVEDDQVDAMTVNRSFKDLKVLNKLIHKVDGREALEYLRDERSDIPCVVLLDLNMPRMNGIEFLKAVKTDDKLKKIPVIVLTTSVAEKDVTESFNLSVAGYIVKPVDYKKFVESIKTIQMYWTLSQLPNGETNSNNLNVAVAASSR
jgi:CheY-like chemotaxis protein